MIKKISLTLLLTSLCLLTFLLFSEPKPEIAPDPQSMTQVAYIIKKGIPSIKNIVIICKNKDKDNIIKQTRTAQLVTKKSMSVLPIKNRTDLISHVIKIKKIKNVIVVVIPDKRVISKDSVKFLVQKLNENKIPLVSLRDKDTYQGALLCLIQDAGKVKKHINLITANQFKIKLTPDFIKDSIIDLE